MLWPLTSLLVHQPPIPVDIGLNPAWSDESRSSYIGLVMRMEVRFKGVIVIEVRQDLCR